MRYLLDGTPSNCKLLDGTDQVSIYPIVSHRTIPHHRQISSLRTHLWFKDEFVQICAIDLLEQKFDGFTKELTITGGVRCTSSGIAFSLRLLFPYPKVTSSP